MAVPPFPLVTLDVFESERRDRHLLHSIVDYWAGRRPDAEALINATRGTRMTWRELQYRSRAAAVELTRMGFGKGDVLATSLPLSTEHILLEYACFRLGVIHSPLDLRLQPAEVLRCLALVRAKGYVFAAPFAALGEAVRQTCGFVEQVMPVEQLRFDGAPDGAGEVTETDGAQVIFTTGSTGSPKAALLSHRGITCQNLTLGTAFGFSPEDRVLCNLPASHVGGQAELLMTTLFAGGTAVVLEIFDAVKSLDAIEQHRVTLVGQIPAMFQMEWRTAGYSSRDLSSLRAVVYGGQSVARVFLDRMLEMGNPVIGTGLGLTEASGFCTFTGLTQDADAVSRGIGWAQPIYDMTIREPMEADGSAGADIGRGTIGHVCFRGPQTFVRYINEPEATAQAVSGDGWLYTGDMGKLDEYGLHFAGRAKWVLKPSGYQVFPGDVEAHIAQLTERVANVGVVGQPHRMWSEGIVAFVEKRQGVELTDAELRRHGRALTSYMRPLHYVILDPGMMPLNRSAKVDVVRLQEMAREEVMRLRERGRWDGGGE